MTSGVASTDRERLDQGLARALAAALVAAIRSEDARLQQQPSNIVTSGTITMADNSTRSAA